MRPCQGRDRGFESRHPRHRTTDVHTSVVFFSLHAIYSLPSLHHYRQQEPQFLSLCQSTIGNEPADPADHDACAFGYGERWGCLAVIPRRAGANPFFFPSASSRAHGCSQADADVIIRARVGPEGERGRTCTDRLWITTVVSAL